MKDSNTYILIIILLIIVSGTAGTVGFRSYGTMMSGYYLYNWIFTTLIIIILFIIVFLLINKIIGGNNEKNKS